MGEGGYYGHDRGWGTPYGGDDHAHGGGLQPCGAQRGLLVQGDEAVQPRQQIEEEVKALVLDDEAAGWEELDITGDTSELADGAVRSSPRPNEPLDQIVGSHPKEGVRLTVSRSVFHSARRSKGKPLRFKGDYRS